jgi:PAS domain S-box-containing protein
MPDRGSAIEHHRGDLRLPAGKLARAAAAALATVASAAALWALLMPPARGFLWPALAVAAAAVALLSGRARWLVAATAACGSIFVLRVAASSSDGSPDIDPAAALVALFVALAAAGKLRGSLATLWLAIGGSLYVGVVQIIWQYVGVGDPHAAISPLLALAAALTIGAHVERRLPPVSAAAALSSGLGVIVAAAAGLAAGAPQLAGFMPGQAGITVEGLLALVALLVAALAAQARRRALALGLLMPVLVLSLLLLAAGDQSPTHEALSARFTLDAWLGQRMQPVGALAVLCAAVGTLLGAVGSGHRRAMAAHWFIGLLLVLSSSLLLAGILIGLPQALDQPLPPMAAAPAALGVMALGAWMLAGDPGTARARSLWLPLLAGMAVVAGTLQMAMLVRNDRIANERRDAAIAAESAELAVLRAIHSRVSALERFAQRQLAVPLAQRAGLFKLEASQALRAGLAMESVARIDGERTILQVESVRDVSDFINHKATFDGQRAATYAAAEQTGRAMVIGPIVIAGTDVKAILVVQPGAFDDQGRGFLIATYGFAQTFELALDPIAPGHAIVLERAGQPLVQRGLPRAGHAWTTAPRREFELLGARWTLRALPLQWDDADAADAVRVERIVTLSGMLLAALVALALRLTALARERAEAAEAAHAGLSVAVAERDHAGAALARSEQQAQRLLEGMSEGVVRLGDGLRIEYANPRAREMLQRLNPEPMGQRLRDLFPRFAGSAFDQRISEALEQRTPVVVDAHVEALDRWLSGRIYPQDDGLIGIFSDVTDLRAAERFEQDQRHVLRAIAAGEDVQSCLTRAARLFEGQHPGTAVGILRIDPVSYRVVGAVAPSLPESESRAWVGVVLTATTGCCGAAAHRRETVVSKDIATDPHWDGYREGPLAQGLGACWSQPIADNAGNIIGTFAVFSAVDRQPLDGESLAIESTAALAAIAIERDLDARRVETERQRFRSLSERSPYMVYAFDLERRLVDCNDNVVREGGFPRETLLGMAAESLVLKPWRDRVKRGFDAALRGESSRFDGKVMTAGRQRREVEITLIPIEVDQRIVGVFGVVRDTTEQHRTAAELDRALHDLTARNRELQDFAFVASHDLQEPLRKVQAFSDRVIERFAHQLDAQGVDWLRRIDAAAHRMQVLIDDLLAYSQVTSHGQPFAPVDLAEVIRDVASDLEVRIDDSGAVLRVGELPVVDGDRTQLRQLLQNLVANALKFRAPDRTPCIEVNAAPAKDDPDQLLLVVEDNGIGFAPAYAERIFAPFQRLHGREEYEGTGIGLAIVRRIVERHRGSIRALGTPGVGTRFEVLLPVRATAAGFNAPAR